MTNIFWQWVYMRPFILSNSSLAYHHRAGRTCKIQKTALSKTHHKTKTEMKHRATSAIIWQHHLGKNILEITAYVWKASSSTNYFRCKDFSLYHFTAYFHTTRNFLNGYVKSLMRNYYINALFCTKVQLQLLLRASTGLNKCNWLLNR